MRSNLRSAAARRAALSTLGVLLAGAVVGSGVVAPPVADAQSTELLAVVAVRQELTEPAWYLPPSYDTYPNPSWPGGEPVTAGVAVPTHARIRLGDTAETLCVEIWTGGAGTAANLWRGDPASGGELVADLDPPIQRGAFSYVESCQTLPPDLLADLWAQPGRYWFGMQPEFGDYQTAQLTAWSPPQACGVVAVSPTQLLPSREISTTVPERQIVVIGFDWPSSPYDPSQGLGIRVWVAFPGGDRPVLADLMAASSDEASGIVGGDVVLPPVAGRHVVTLEQDAVCQASIGVVVSEPPAPTPSPSPTFEARATATPAALAPTIAPTATVVTAATAQTGQKTLPNTAAPAGDRPHGPGLFALALVGIAAALTLGVLRRP